jgi:hypothetical protein
MKKVFTLSMVILITLGVFAQAPQKMSYQAVIRDADQKLVVNHVVGMRISILQGPASGTVVYTETQTPTTNANGLVSIEIGDGTGFDAINWGNGPYFIKTETDPTGGANYTITGTSQLLSVPYALYAKTANTHYVGESYGGGIVFYVYDNGQHGLIAATEDQSTSIRWNAGTSTNTIAMADGVGAGKTNTAIIIANQGYGDGATYAARICNEYQITVGGVTYGDWYLPSKFELNLLYLQRTVVGGFANLDYWSSTENFNNLAWVQAFLDGVQGKFIKNSTVYVRAVRAF